MNMALLGDWELIFQQLHDFLVPVATEKLAMRQDGPLQN